MGEKEPPSFKSRSVFRTEIVKNRISNIFIVSLNMRTSSQKQIRYRLENEQSD